MTKQEMSEFICWVLSTYAIADESDIVEDDSMEMEEKYFLQLTLGTTAGRDSFGWQTGDNSYAGGAYSYPLWAVVSLDLRKHSDDKYHDSITQEIFNQWDELS